MTRITRVLLVLTIVITAGCAGVLGGQETTAPVIPPTDTEAGTVSDTSASTINRTFTLFTGGIAPNSTSLGPRVLNKGNEATVRLQITNREGQRINYTTVIQLVRLDGTGSNATVTERRTLDRFTIARKAVEGANQTITRTITPNTTGENLLLGFHLYKSEPPATPTFNNSYKYFAVPINVTDSSRQTTRSSS